MEETGPLSIGEDACVVTYLTPTLALVSWPCNPDGFTEQLQPKLQQLPGSLKK